MQQPGTFAPGEVLESPYDRYELLAQLGQGGFGVTWRARRASDGDTVVVKQLRMERVGDWKAVELFEREGQVLGTLRHRSIPRYLDSWTLGDTQAPAGFALVQSYVEGPTLQQLLERGQRLDARVMFNWLWCMLETCSHLHGLNPPVIHRDISPKNIILRDVDHGDAVLIDFGTVQAALISATAISSTAAGTFGYAPPEQFVGRATPGSDLYGLAMTWLAVATGQPPERMPFQGHRVDVAAALANAGVDARLRMLLGEMTDPDPARRPASAEVVMQRLAPLRRGIEPPPVAGTSAPEGREADLETGPTVALDSTAIEARMRELAGGDAGGDPAKATSLAHGTDPELELECEARVALWLEAQQRLATLGDTPSWSPAPGVPLGDLERVCFDDAGTRALLIGYTACYLLDLEQMAVQLLVDDRRSERAGAFSADGSHAVIADYHGETLYLITASPGDGRAEVRTVHLSELKSLDDELRVAISPDHALIALARQGRWSDDEPAAMLLVDWTSGSVVDRPHSLCHHGLGFAPDGQHLICNGTCATEIFDSRGDKARLEARYMALSPDGATMAIVPIGNRDDDEVQIGPVDSLVPLRWRPGKAFEVAPGESGDIMGLRFSPDGSRLLVRWCSREREEHVLLIDPRRGRTVERIAAPFSDVDGIDDIHDCAITGDGRRLLIDADSPTTPWNANAVRALLFWDLTGEEPRYLGAIMMAVRQTGAAAALIVNGKRVSAKQAGEMGITVTGGDHPPEVLEALARFIHAEDDPAPSEVPFGRTAGGFFGRLDAARSLGAIGFVPHWERPDVVAGALCGGAEDDRLHGLEPLLRADFDQRAVFFAELVLAGDLHIVGDLTECMNVSRGLTHLLPEIVTLAEAASANRPRFGGGESLALSMKSVVEACARLRDMAADERTARFEDMLERERDAVRREHASAAEAAEARRREEAEAWRQIKQKNVAEVAEINAMYKEQQSQLAELARQQAERERKAYWIIAVILALPPLIMVLAAVAFL